MMLAGLRSQWSTLLECAKASASQTLSMMESPSCKLSGDPRSSRDRIHSASVWPRTRRMVK